MRIHEWDVPLLRTIDRRFDRDLAAIVARATERRTADRIATAGQLADYLQRYLDGRPLPIRPPSSAERGWRWVRRHKGAVAAGVLLLGVATGGLWSWDAYYREHIEYYVNVTKRWGLPEGVGRLTDEQFRRRNSTLMFIKRGRQGAVHEIRIVNSRGAYPPLAMHTNVLAYAHLNPLRQERNDQISEAMATCRVIFERDGTGRILSQSGYNRADRRLYTLHYAHPNVAEYKEGAFAKAVRESGITHIQFVRPEEGPEAGLDKELRFLDREGTPQPNHDGAYGYRYIFDQRGLDVEETPLGADGQPTVVRNGIARFAKARDALGNMIQADNFGRDGQPVLDNAGVAGAKIAYDQYGNTTEMAFFGTDSRLVTVQRLGAAGRSFRYDEQGNVVESTLFDPKRQPVIGSHGIAKSIKVWDAQGRALEAYFGADGKPITMHRAVKGRIVWDQRGYPVEVAFLDEHNHPIRNDVGCAKVKPTHDKQGNRAEDACFDEADQPVRNTEGSAKSKRVFDDRGNAIEEAYFGPDGRPDYYEERYVKTRSKYNPQGNPIELVYLDATERPVKSQKGYAKVTHTYDMHGRVVEVAYFDEAGQPTPHKDGYATIRKTYDTRGQLIEETLFDPEGKPARHDDGYVKQKFAYDHRGYRIETAYYDENDQLTLSTDGYAKQLSQYNDRGQLVERAFVDRDGAFVLHKKYGYAKARWTYNERGKVEQMARFDPQDQLMQTINGYAVSRYIYDDFGRETQRVFLDLNEAPVHTRVATQDVESDTNSQRLGLQVGDLILGYDGEDVRNTHVFEEFELIKGERPRQLRILRDGTFVSIDVPPGRLQGLDLADRVPPESTKPGT
jgi:YD repeat-containing protein